MLDPSRKYLRVGTPSLLVLSSLFLKPLRSQKQITISKTFDVHVLNSHLRVINLDSLLQAVLGSYRFDVILCKALKQSPFLAAPCFNLHRLSLPRNRSLFSLKITAPGEVTSKNTHKLKSRQIFKRKAIQSRLSPCWIIFFEKRASYQPLFFVFYNVRDYAIYNAPKPTFFTNLFFGPHF